jgi:hypothetical protein
VLFVLDENGKPRGRGIARRDAQSRRSPAAQKVSIGVMRRLGVRAGPDRRTDVGGIRQGQCRRNQARRKKSRIVTIKELEDDVGLESNPSCMRAKQSYKAFHRLGRKAGRADLLILDD